MRILVINPNTTSSMTAKIEQCARSMANDSTEIVARNPGKGPVSIEGHYDEVISSPHLIEQIQFGVAEGFDGFVVACFDDPALGACREVASGPVVGISQAAMYSCAMIASGFSIITMLPRSIPIIEENVLKYGMSRHCRKVRAVDLPVLALEKDQGAKDRVLEEILRSRVEDSCEAVILGCAGMSDLTEWLTEQAGIPVIDGVRIAVKTVEGLIAAGMRTSHVGGYAEPRKKMVYL